MPRRASVQVCSSAAILSWRCRQRRRRPHPPRSGSPGPALADIRIIIRTKYDQASDTEFCMTELGILLCCLFSIRGRRHMVVLWYVISSLRNSEIIERARLRSMVGTTRRRQMVSLQKRGDNRVYPVFRFPGVRPTVWSSFAASRDVCPAENRGF